jgi:pimeloyl-ACP methyl ester carboxylesterase
MKDVIVLLPGIMGSALRKDGTTVWDTSVGAFGRALFSLGASVKDLALDSDGSTGEGVEATRLMQNVHLVPYLWKIDGYSGISRYLQSRLGATLGEDYFEFPYDWRLDNRISAQRLADASAEWLERKRQRHPDARLVLIGHSMGGLVARYFIEALGGWRDTRMLITLGTPHRGSVKALDYLANGMRKRLGPVTLIELSDFIQSLPSVHQLLPIYPCLGTTADELQRLEEIDRTSIGMLDVARARAGIEFHREIERAVDANRPKDGYGYRLIPVVGTYQPTFLSALLDDDGVEPLETYKGDTLLYGDGTVPRLSATPIEYGNANAESFAACPHASLQNFDPIRVQMRAALQDTDISELKAVAAEAISLDLRDAFTADEAFVTRARCPGRIDPMRASLVNLDTEARSEHEFVPSLDAHGWQELRTSALTPGTYRIRVEAGSAEEPIEDVFAVVG